MEEGLRGTVRRRNYHAVDTVTPFFAAFIERSVSIEERSDPARMSVLYSELLRKVLFHQRDNGSMESELARLRSDNGKFKSVVEKPFAPHCSTALFSLKFHLLDL